MKDIIEEYLNGIENEIEVEKKEKLNTILLNNVEYNLTLFHIVDDEWRISLYNKSCGELCSHIEINGYNNALEYFNNLVEKYGDIQ